MENWSILNEYRNRLVPNKYVFFYAFPYLNGKYHKNIIKLDYLNGQQVDDNDKQQT